MHVGNGGLRIRLMNEENVGGATIGTRLSVQRQVQVLDLAVLAKDLAQMLLLDIFGEALDYHLGASRRL